MAYFQFESANHCKELVSVPGSSPEVCAAQVSSAFSLRGLEYQPEKIHVIIVSGTRKFCSKTRILIQPTINNVQV